MRFQKIPYYLRYSIDEIIADARKNIAVHYLHNIVHAAGKTASRGGTGCQIIDNTDYSGYFYEPKKFEMLWERTIRSLDQRSAHQNAIIAFKKWEQEVREFLSDPTKILGTRTEIISLRQHPTSPEQVRAVLKNSSQLRKSRHVRVRLNESPDSLQK
jgi:hypothetical protein